MNEHGTRVSESIGAGRPPALRLMLGAVAPALLIGLIGSVLIWFWRDDLPAVIATHFDGSGAPDGFTGTTGVVVMPAVAGLVAAVVGALLMLPKRSPRPVVAAITGVVAGTTMFVTVVSVMLVGGQRGLADGADAEFSGWAVLGGVVLGLAVGLLAAESVPRWTEGDDAAAGRRPVAALGYGERFAWTRRASSAMVNSVVLASILAIVAIGILASLPMVLVLAAVLVIPLVLMWSIRVTVSRAGVSVRGVLGWPRMVIGIDDIEYAEVVEVNAIRDFGGYGYRLGFRGAVAGSMGFVFSSGSGMLVRRRDGGGTVIVVGDAETAVGLVNAMKRSGA